MREHFLGSVQRDLTRAARVTMTWGKYICAVLHSHTDRQEAEAHACQQVHNNVPVQVYDFIAAIVRIVEA